MPSEGESVGPGLDVLDSTKRGFQRCWGVSDGFGRETVNFARRCGAVPAFTGTGRELKHNSGLKPVDNAGGWLRGMSGRAGMHGDHIYGGGANYDNDQTLGGPWGISWICVSDPGLLRSQVLSKGLMYAPRQSVICISPLSLKQCAHASI
jgi:hypothetical protein